MEAGVVGKKGKMIELEEAHKWMGKGQVDNYRVEGCKGQNQGLDITSKQVGLEKEMANEEVEVRPCDILEVYQNEMSTEQGLAGEKRKKRRGLGKEMANDEV
ncbi:hypothetical protein L7F22_010698 [Adiantum nelumboides]|nr:hypothetical protein [Adiantum nelumboides]